VLDFNNNKITCDAADAIASAVDNNAMLEKLYLNDNLLGIGVKTIAIALMNSSNLIELSLNNNQIPECVTQYLANVILRNHMLQVVAVGSNVLKTDGIATIARALRNTKMLKTLHVSHNEATEEAADFIAPVISNNSGLEKLYCGDNKLGAGVLMIAEALKSILTLKILDLSNNDIPVAVATKLASAIESNYSLEELLLKGNKLTTTGVVPILKALTDIFTLRKLDISSTLVTEDVVDAIAPLLAGKTALEELYLSYNNLKKGVIKAIIILKGNTSLRILKLDNNNNSTSKLQVDDLEEIIIDNSCVLQKLWLANNNLRANVILILHSLSKITTLTKMDLSGNYIPEKASGALAVVINNNKFLEGLNLSNNNLQTNGVITVAQSLRVIYQH